MPDPQGRLERRGRPAFRACRASPAHQEPTAFRDPQDKLGYRVPPGRREFPASQDPAERMDHRDRQVRQAPPALRGPLVHLESLGRREPLGLQGPPALPA